MKEPKEDQKPAASPTEGDVQAGAEGSDIAKQIEDLQKQNEDLRKKQADADRKVTELVTEKSAIERRLEQVTAPRPNQQVNQVPVQDEIGKVIAEALNEASYGNAESASQKLQNTFNQALTSSQAQAVQTALAQLEVKSKLDRHMEKTKTEKPFVSRLEEAIKVKANEIFQMNLHRGTPISLEDGWDKAVSHYESIYSDIIKTNQVATPAPKGSQGEMSSSGARPDPVHVDLAAKGEEPEDYIKERKARLQRQEGVRNK